MSAAAPAMTPADRDRIRSLGQPVPLEPGPGRTAFPPVRGHARDLVRAQPARDRARHEQLPRLGSGHAHAGRCPAPVFDLPIGPAVALFFLLSAIAHFTVAFPARRWYERRLARGQNPARWIEYAFSSSVMIVVIASLTGIREIGTLIAIFGVNAGDDPVRLEHGGRQRGPRAAPVAALRLRLHRWAPCPGSSSASSLLTAATAPGAAADPRLRHRDLRLAVHQLQRLRDQHGPPVPRRSAAGATTCTASASYMLLSLVAKTLLAWQVFSGTLRP